MIAAIGVSQRGPYRSAILPTTGEISPVVQVPAVTANAMVLRSHPISSNMRRCMPPRTREAIPVVANAATAAVPSTSQP